MKSFIPSLVAVLAIFSPAALASPANFEAEGVTATAQLEARGNICTVTAVNNLMFKTSLANFQKARKAQNPKLCIWKNDGCSWSPDRPSLVYNFRPSCDRHDFGYRNTKKQNRFKPNKKKIDNQFYTDLKHYCNTTFKGLKFPLRPRCLVYAKVYYEAVKKFGKRDLEGTENNDFLAKRAEAIDEVTRSIEEVANLEFEEELGIDVEELASLEIEED